MRTLIGMVLAVGAGLTAVSTVRAGLYPPDEPPAFRVGADGLAQPLPYSPVFLDALGRVMQTIAEPPNLPPREKRSATPREQALEQLAKLDAKGANLTPDEMVQKSALLIRLRKLDDALRLLSAASRDPRYTRTRGFQLYSHLSLVHLHRGELRDALRYLIEARSEFPAEPDQLQRGMTKEQLAWYRRIEREYLFKLLSGRVREQEGQPPGRPAAVLTPDDLFGVRFVGEGGTYEPGKFAAAERAKLPKDAVAVVQQLLLWVPGDERLSWLLAELYNAEGNLDAAAQLLDGRVANGFQTPDLREHRRLIKEAIAARPPQEAPGLETAAGPESPPPEDWLPDGPRLWLVGGVAVVLVLVLAYWQTRELMRRGRPRLG